jgi:DNA modification methylase
VIDVAHRDCFDSLAVMREGGGVDLILTSPPYPDARTPEQYGGAKFDTTLAGYSRLGEAVFKALKPGGVCALNLDGPIRVWRHELGESERSLVAFEVALDWAKRIGFRYVERCIYAREGVPGDHGPRWRSGGEIVHVFARPGGPIYFDKWGYTVPAKLAGQHYSSGGSRRLGGRTSRGSWTQASRRMLSTVISCSVGNNQTDRDHGAPFAAQLADAFVLCYSPPGGLVGDPFVGSGTVAQSAHKHGRRFIGGDTGVRERDGRAWADIVKELVAQQRLFVEANA